MGKSEISYLELKNKITAFLEEKRAIVLATSSNNQVIARTVSYVNNELEIYFWSYRNHTKCQQIKDNPRVALCRDYLQVEGIASLHGSILDPQNKDYLVHFRKKFPKMYENYINEPEMILITVEPTLFVMLVNIDGTLYRDHLNVTKKQVYRIGIKEDSRYGSI